MSFKNFCRNLKAVKLKDGIILCSTIAEINMGKCYVFIIIVNRDERSVFLFLGTLSATDHLSKMFLKIFVWERVAFLMCDVCIARFKSSLIVTYWKIGIL